MYINFGHSISRYEQNLRNTEVPLKIINNHKLSTQLQSIIYIIVLGQILRDNQSCISLAFDF